MPPVNSLRALWVVTAMVSTIICGRIKTVLGAMMVPSTAVKDSAPGLRAVFEALPSSTACATIFTDDIGHHQKK